MSASPPEMTPDERAPRSAGPPSPDMAITVEPEAGMAPVAGEATLGSFSTAVARRYALGVGTPAINLVLALGTNALVSRILGPAAFGEFAVATTVVLMLSAVVGLGLPLAIARFVSGTDKSRTADNETYWSAGWTILGVSAAVAIIAAVLRDLTAPALLGRWVPHGLATLIAVAACSSAMVDLSAARSQMQRRFDLYFLRVTGAAVLRLIGIAVALMVAEPTAAVALLGYAVGSIVAGLAGAGAAIAKSVRRAGDGARNARRELLASGTPIMASSIVVAAMTYLDLLVLAQRAQPESIGLYAAALRLTGLHTAVVGGLTTVTLPLAAGAAASGDTTSYFRKTLAIGSVVGLVGVLGTTLLASLLTRFLYGDTFLGAAGLFVILAWGVLPNYPGNPLSQLLYVTGRSSVMLAMQLAQLVLLLAGLDWAAQRNGVTGVAIYRSLVNAAVVIVIILFASRARRSAPVPLAQSR